MLHKTKKATRERRSIEFKVRAVQMAEDSKNIGSVAQELNIPVQSLHNWVKAYRKGELGENIKLLPDHITYVALLCKNRARELKAQRGEKNSSSVQREMQTLQILLAALQTKAKN